MNRARLYKKIRRYPAWRQILHSLFIFSVCIGVFAISDWLKTENESLYWLEDTAMLLAMVIAPLAGIPIFIYQHRLVCIFPKMTEHEKSFEYLCDSTLRINIGVLLVGVAALISHRAIWGAGPIGNESMMNIPGMIKSFFGFTLLMGCIGGSCVIMFCLGEKKRVFIEKQVQDERDLNANN